ncbi:MAG TPA: hypothetical protein PK904_15185 [Bacteroidales bacterium]|nr:hypothetical protein [Bacteroidales bacterium]
MKKIGLIIAAAMLLNMISIAQNTINDPFFEKVSFVGAFGTTDWTQGWANYDPQNTVYPATTMNVPAGNITVNTHWKSSESPVIGAASFSNPRLQDPFFEPVNYVGAFGTYDWTEGWANFDPQNTIYPSTTVTVPAGNITTNTTWTSSNVYLLNGWVYVKAGATLTIEPGTIIRGSKNNQGALIIEKDGKLIASGTKEQPIIFTSNEAAGSRDYGDWGGVIVLGNAVINVPGGSATIEGGVGSTYGGTNDNDNSGVLKYIRIEFPGIAFAPNNEINGLTMGGVGSQTEIDYVQVSYCGDDSFEWFGGTVNAKHLIAYRGWDDDFDTDFGFRGKIQFAVSLRDPNVADVSGSNGFESDNDGSGSGNLPKTRPLFSNISIFGPRVNSTTPLNGNYKRAMHLRRNTETSIYNSIITAWVTGLFIDGTAAQANATANTLQIENTFLVGMQTNFASTFENMYFNTPARNNQVFTNNNDLSLTDPFNLTNPNFLPAKQVYKLDGWVYVKSGATLTIDPGTVIRGDLNNKGALIVEQGAKIYANGTEEEPIVFTSNQAPGTRNYGDWGGVIILGYAPINVPGGTSTIEGGVGSIYGGNDPDDNSGVFKYCRIEFSGIAFAPNNEINGLTMGGVGRGTEIHHVQVSYGGDDAFEWFGGNVNAKHLIALRNWDDDFDTDFGFQGMIQFAVSLRDPAIADVSGSNGFESDNDGSGSGNTPKTHPLFSNVSIFGPKATSTTPIHADYKRSMHLRRNTETSVYNSLFAGYPTGLFIDGTATQNNATNDVLQIRNTFMSGMTGNFASAFEESYFQTPARENKTFVNNNELMITDPFNLTNPNFLPLEGSPVLFNSLWTYPVTGVVTYQNASSTPLSEVTVQILSQGGDLINSALTNVNGEYNIRVLDGIYVLTANADEKPWGGVNIIDGLQIRQFLVGQVTFNALQSKAANVDVSPTVNILDFVTTRQKIAGLNPANWKIANYVFETPLITVSGAPISKDFQGLCGGDVNGSHNPLVLEPFQIYPLSETALPQQMNK